MDRPTDADLAGASTPDERDDWHTTPLGDPRGYVQPHALTEL